MRAGVERTDDWHPKKEFTPRVCGRHGKSTYLRAVLHALIVLCSLA